MIPYFDYLRLVMDASECATLDSYIAECGGSVPIDDVEQTVQLLEIIWNMSHDGLNIRRISSACGIPVRQIAMNYGIPQRTLENWSDGSRTPSDWQLALIAYAVTSDYLAEQASRMPQRAKEEITVTMISAHKIDKNGCQVGDEFPELVALGYDKANARALAIRDMRYSCQSDFTNPHTIKDGYECWFGPARAVELVEGEDEDDVDFESTVYVLDGKRYAVAWDWIEGVGVDSITSTEMRAEEIAEREQEV